jgi:drug/metabolite transporter (DMT)-like permease
MLFYNSLLSIVPLLALAALTGEAASAVPTYLQGAGQHGQAAVACALLLCATGGILLNFTMFLATVAGSALTMTLIGNVKTVLVLALGFVLLGGAELTWLMAIGILLTLVGGSWYSSLRFSPEGIRRMREETAASSEWLAEGGGL